jgi:mono/diheme cytochrome c family protein
MRTGIIACFHFLFYSFMTLTQYLTFIIFILFSAAIKAQVVEINIPSSAKSLNNPYKNTSNAPASGARVYKKVCWTCHGDGGRGTGPQAVELKTKPADYKDPKVVARTDGELFWWISNGGPDMQPFNDALSEDEIWQVITYVRYLQKSK